MMCIQDPQGDTPAQLYTWARLFPEKKKLFQEIYLLLGVKFDIRDIILKVSDSRDSIG